MRRSAICAPSGPRTGASLAGFDTRNMSAELDELVKRANASDVTFFAVDARGLVPEGATASNDDPLANRPGVSFIAREDSQAGMKLIARDTDDGTAVGFATLYWFFSSTKAADTVLMNVPLPLAPVP